ncbi:MAG TPA: hypothetical protein VFJ50_07305 [Gemmatimonadales bacterium]|nr:hypothetical protein [Gemmatimonadales bacterium]
MAITPRGTLTPVDPATDIAEFLTTRRAEDGLSLAVFTAEPGSASQHALDLRASWAATPIEH